MVPYKNVSFSQINQKHGKSPQREKCDVACRKDLEQISQVVCQLTGHTCFFSKTELGEHY